MLSRTRWLLVALVALLVVLPGVVVAGSISGTRTEQVVEGHNVFTSITSANNRNVTGVTILVREKVVAGGKLWFNDQYLINPQQSFATSSSPLKDCAYEPDGSYACNRYPCGGVVVVVPAGQAKPYATDGERGILNPAIDALGRPEGFSNPEVTEEQWIEQYFITDPNDHTFVIDKYAGDPVYFYDEYDKISDFPGGPAALDEQTYEFAGTFWMVNLLGSPDFIPDDGTSNCGAYVDNPPAGAFEPALIDGQLVCYDGNVQGPDGCLYDAYDNNASYLYPDASPVDGKVYHAYRRYNAEVVFYMNDLFSGRKKDGVVHNRTFTNATNGCDSNTYQRNADGTSTTVSSEWRCPDGNDAYEGNSHPFNPFGPQAPGDPGWDNEHAHDTALIDIYYYPTYRPHQPTSADRAAKGWRLYDAEGSGAPFDPHDGAHP